MLLQPLCTQVDAQLLQLIVLKIDCVNVIWFVNNVDLSIYTLGRPVHV